LACVSAPPSGAIPVQNPCVSLGAPTVLILNPFAAGESRVLRTFQLQKQYFQKLTASVDPDGAIPEKDETNNVLDLLAVP